LSAKWPDWDQASGGPNFPKTDLISAYGSGRAAHATANLASANIKGKGSHVDSPLSCQGNSRLPQKTVKMEQQQFFK
jgi:hypothetical protein